jgi:hypothetical protein
MVFFGRQRPIGKSFRRGNQFVRSIDRTDQVTAWAVSKDGDNTCALPSIAAVIAVVAGAAMVFFGRRGAKA